MIFFRFQFANHRKFYINNNIKSINLTILMALVYRAHRSGFWGRILSQKVSNGNLTQTLSNVFNKIRFKS